VAGGLFIRGGARNMTEKNAGIERLMLATAVEAGKDLSRQNVRRELSSLGSAIGSSVSNDFSVVSLGSTRENFDRTWAIFSGVMMNPAFAEEDLNRNRAQILTGLREAGAVPEAALETMQDRLLYSGHPYANDVNGTVATVGSFTAEDLRAYHRHIMETSRLLLVFVGDLDAQQLRAKVAETFGKLPKGDHKDQPYPQLDFSKGTLDVTQRALPTTYVKGTFAAPPLNSPDYSTMRVAMSILQTLVYQEVRGRLQLSYAPDADMNNFAANTANISVSTNDPNQAVAAMLNQIKVLQTRTLNDEVIDEISAFFLTRHYLGQETSGAQVGELARYELVGGGWRNSFEFLNHIREVKAADVQTVANKYMKNIRFVVIGDQPAVNRSVFIPG
jgi:zinc protease